MDGRGRVNRSLAVTRSFGDIEHKGKVLAAVEQGSSTGPGPSAPLSPSALSSSPNVCIPTSPVMVDSPVGSAAVFLTTIGTHMFLSITPVTAIALALSPTVKDTLAEAAPEVNNNLKDKVYSFLSNSK